MKTFSGSRISCKTFSQMNKTTNNPLRNFGGPVLQTLHQTAYILYSTSQTPSWVIVSLFLQHNVYHTGHEVFWFQSHWDNSIFDQFYRQDQDFFALPFDGFPVPYLHYKILSGPLLKFLPKSLRKFPTSSWWLHSKAVIN